MTITATEQTVETINYAGVEITLVDQNTESIRRYFDGHTSGATLFRGAAPTPMGRVYLGSASVESVKSSDLPEGQDRVFFGFTFSETASDEGVGIMVDPRPKPFKRLPEGHENHETHFMPLNARLESIPNAEAEKFFLACPNPVTGAIYGGLIYGSFAQFQGINSDTASFIEFVADRGNLAGREVTHGVSRLPLYYRVPVAEAYTPRIVAMSEVEKLAWEGKNDAEKYESILGSLQSIGLNEVEDMGRITCQKYYIVGNHPSHQHKWQIGKFDTDGDFHQRTFIEYATLPEGAPASETKFKVNYERRGYELSRDWEDGKVFELPNNWHEITSGVAPVAPGSVQGNSMITVRSLLNGFNTRMDSMNEALNEYAEEAGHCSEFEDSVVPLGFSGRESHNTVRWDVDVEVDFTYTDDSLTSRDTSYMEEVTGVDNLMAGGEVTFTGTTTVSISMEGPRDADAMYFSDRISMDDVLEELSGDVEISEWRVEDWNDNN